MLACEEWVLYELTPNQIIQKVKDTVPSGELIVADNARPEIIREMQMAGIQVVPCVKQENIGGQKVGVLGQLEKMAEYKFIAYGKTLEEEYLDYRFAESKDGTFVSKIPSGNDHCLDALRYVWYWVHRRDILETAMSNILREYK